MRLDLFVCMIQIGINGNHFIIHVNIHDSQMTRYVVVVGFFKIKKYSS